jgi:hypothetical protein
MVKRWNPPKEDRTDADAIRREREFQRDLGDILEYGTEDNFVALLKSHTPNIGREELLASIMQFRVYVREKRGLR